MAAVLAVLDGKPVIVSQNEILKILNANQVYEKLTELDPKKSKYLLKAQDTSL